MIWIAAILMWAIGISGTVFLVISEHPWFALLVLLTTGCMSFRDRDNKGSKKEVSS